MDPELVNRTKGLSLFHSDNDKEGIQNSVKEIRSTIKNINYREFHLGHFTYGSMQTQKFPELLAELTDKK